MVTCLLLSVIRRLLDVIVEAGADHDSGHSEIRVAQVGLVMTFSRPESSE